MARKYGIMACILAIFLISQCHTLLHRLPGNERNLHHRQLENSAWDVVTAFSLVDGIGLAMFREYTL
jgi:hypothetical protein